ncbi:F-actin-capping protein subunit alpha [Kalaharituber pfeilii]|nr:F-actin-capping protein subunit alpha [Kalaharituber pfeilii]
MDIAEKIETTSSFVLDAPPGELNEVLADIKSLVSDSPDVIKGLAPALERYNKEQLTAVKLSGAAKSVLISEYNTLPDGHFFDVESNTSWNYDHEQQKSSNVQSWTLESANSSLIKSLLRELDGYVKEHYPASPLSGVYPYDNDASVAIVIVGSKYSPSNFWNGRWRSTYIYSPSDATLAGTIKVDVHYYEDGNVRLLTKKEISETIRSGASAADVVKAIAALEKKYQEELNKAFGALSEGAFKNLRRQLPVTRQKINWEKITTYRLPQDIGGGRSVGR